MNYIHHFIKSHKLISANDTIIIGLSGGPDSVYLLHLLVAMRTEYNLTLIAAHLNHEWRPEADDEEKMCHKIAQEQNIPFIAKKLSSFMHLTKYNGSKEDYARSIRRIFLEKIAQEHNAQSIALGHHVNDQQETFFIRLIRGSSLTGLTGIKPRSGLYIRPLLETNKESILAWLTQQHKTYAIDKSNSSPDYLRNRIRMSVIPALQKCDERFEQNFLQTLYRLQEDNTYINRMTEQTFKKIALYEKGTIFINLTEFAAIDIALHHRIIIHWLMTEKVKFPVSTSFFNEIIRFLLSPHGGKHTVNKHWSIVKKQNKGHVKHETI